MSTSLVPQQPVVVSVTKPTLIVSVLLLFITLGGFGTIFAAANGLAHVLQGNDPLMGIIMFGMTTILVVDVFLVRLLTKLINSSLSPNNNRPRQMPGYLPANIPAMQPQSPMTGRLAGASVTEGTTRFFEPYRSSVEVPARTTSEKLES